jgi:hypothetical protein
MNQIPEFKNLLEMVEETIKSMSNDILLQHSNKEQYQKKYLFCPLFLFKLKVISK